MAKSTKTKNAFDPAQPPKHVHQRQDIPVPEPESLMPFPVIKLLQALSPELDDSDPKFHPDAAQGDLLITDGTRQVIIDGDTGFKFSPILVRKVWNEWIPRKQGGGFVASYNSKQEMEMGYTQGNEIVVSIDYLIATNEINEDGELSTLLLQFNTPTKMALARQMASFISKYGTMEGVTYHLTAAKQKNRAGQSYYNFSIVPVGWTNEALCGQIREMITESEAKFLPMEDDTPAF